jgi:F-type H+-transporting ATPase subunit epsilon
MSELMVRLVSPDSVLYEGPAVSVVAPAWDGKIGILPSHAPMIALLGSGELSIDLPEGGSQSFFVAGGVLRIEGDELMILTEYGGDTAPDEPPARAALNATEILDAMESAG